MSDQPIGPGRLKLGAKQFESLNQPTTAEKPDTGSDVRSILSDNLKVSAPLEKPVDLTPRRSRRGRDYWTVLLVGNALLVGLVAVLPKNPFTLVYGFSGVVVFSVGLTWVVWGVMSDY
jgi:hypothetical protein